MSAESADTATLGQIANELARLKEENQRLRERVEDLDEKMEEQAAENERLRERVETLEQQAEESPDVEWDGKENHIENLTVDNVPLGLIVNRHGERLDEEQDRVDNIVDDAGARIDPEMESDLTPIERIHLLGADEAGVRPGSKLDRALTIFENLKEWSNRRPNGGRVLRTGPDNTLYKLKAERPDDEYLKGDWNPVYRAFDKLGELGGDKIEYHDDEKRLVIPEDASFSYRRQPSSSAPE